MRLMRRSLTWKPSSRRSESRLQRSIHRYPGRAGDFCHGSERTENGEQDAGPNDEERGQPHVPSRTPLARSSSSVSSALGRYARLPLITRKKIITVAVVLGVALVS